MDRRIAPGTRLLILSSLLLAACGESAPIAPADAGAAVDAHREVLPPFDAGRIEGRDGGAFEIDAGTCDTWGLTDEGEPIAGLVPGEWIFVDVPEAHCANGSSTGFAVNLSPTGSDRLVIYLEGGGACFDETSCASVAGGRGYDAETLEVTSIVLSGYGIFRREDESNPARDWNQVYIPYCTGDAHAGTNAAGFGGREHVGFSNVTHDLRRIVPTFRDPAMVLLTGASAGGLGALANFDQVQQAFGCSPVHLLDDSGPILEDDYLRPCLQSLTRELWGIVPPADCPQCTMPDGGGLAALWPYLATKYPDRRFALLSNTADSTIRSFYGAGITRDCRSGARLSSEVFEEGLVDLRDRALAPFPNAATFYVESDAHTFLIGGFETPVAGGITLGEWVQRMLDGADGWQSVGP